MPLAISQRSPVQTRQSKSVEILTLLLDAQSRNTSIQATVVDEDEATQEQGSENPLPQAIQGFVANVDDPEWKFRLADHAGKRSLPPGALVRLCFSMGGSQFEFHSEFLRISADSPHAMIMRVPTYFKRIERRKSARRTLRAPATVTIHKVRDDDTQVQGVLLNLSADGLACLVEGVDRTEKFQTGDVIVEFQPACASEAFRFPARVVTITPGSDADSAIFGISFLDQEMARSERIRLRSLLLNQNVRDPDTQNE